MEEEVKQIDFHEESKPLKPYHYLPRSIVGTVMSGSLCCIPIGLPGLLAAVKVNRLYESGQYAEAQEASERARKWSVIGIVAGIIGIVAVIVLEIAAFMFQISQ